MDYDGKYEISLPIGGGQYDIDIDTDCPDGKLSVWDESRGQHYPIPLDNLVEFAKAGGKMPEERGKAPKNPSHMWWNWEDIMKALKDANAWSMDSMGMGQTVSDDIRALAADRDKWRTKAWQRSAPIERDRIRDLEGQLAKADEALEVAWATISLKGGKWPAKPLPEPKPPAEVRCIECEHCDVRKLEVHVDGSANAHCAMESRITPCAYSTRTCGRFTPAAVGCGSAEQALRAELIRVSKEGVK